MKKLLLVIMFLSFTFPLLAQPVLSVANTVTKDGVRYTLKKRSKLKKRLMTKGVIIKGKKVTLQYVNNTWVAKK